MRGSMALSFAAMLLGSAAWASVAQDYKIDLNYDPGTGKVTASSSVMLKPEPQAKAIVFYLHDALQVSEVRLGGRKLAFRQKAVDYDYNYTTKANRVEVDTAGLDVTKGLHVIYAGRFSPSANRSVSDYMRGDGDGLYLRAYAYSLWFPTFEAAHQQPGRADYRLRVTAPASFRAVFVGEKLARTEKNGLATETWAGKDISGFDPQLTIRRFRETKIGPVTVYYLEDAESVAAAQRVADLSNRLLAYYRSHYRAAAADRPIYVVQETAYGDIASANVIGVQDKAWRTMAPDSWEAVMLAHELVHAFVQTPTPVNDPFIAFSNEGFPSYFHLSALASVLGDAYYESALDKAQKGYLERRSSGKDGNGDALPPEKPILAMSFDDIGIYKDTFVLNDRALLCLDYLRRKMGRQTFDRFVRDLTARKTVLATDFFALIQHYAPAEETNLQRWLETTDFPDNFRRLGE